MDPRLALTWLASIAFEVLFPIALALYLRRRYRVSWRYFTAGAVVFLVAQLVTRVPAVQLLQSRMAGVLSASTLAAFLWIVGLSLSAGLFEEVGRYLGFRYLVKGARSWKSALMYGTGHGGLESIVLVGGLSLASFIGVQALLGGDLGRMNLTPEQMEQARQQIEQVRAMEWWLPALAAWERAIAMALQLSLAVLVLQCFRRSQARWLWLAVAYTSSPTSSL